MNILREAQNGASVAEVFKTHNTSNALFYRWRSKYGGLDASMISELKSLQEENRRLKKMYAEVQLQKELAGGCAKKVVKPSKRREMAIDDQESGRISIRLACRIFSSVNLVIVIGQFLGQRMKGLLTGSFAWLQALGIGDLAYATCICAMLRVFYGTISAFTGYIASLSLLRIKPKKRIVREKPDALKTPEDLNPSPAERVIRSLEQIMEWRGTPQSIRCDNGPEYISSKLKAWALKKGIQINYIQPGNPQQNAYVERFNRIVRYNCLNQDMYSNIEKVQEKVTKCLWHYKNERPNMALLVSPLGKSWQWPQSKLRLRHDFGES